MLGSLYLSFTKFNLLNSPRWLGLDNYVQIFKEDDSFLHSMGLTFQYALLSVPLRLIFALLVAMALNKGIRALGVYRTVYYIPSLLGEALRLPSYGVKYSTEMDCSTNFWAGLVFKDQHGSHIPTIFCPRSLRYRFGNLDRRWLSFSRDWSKYLLICMKHRKSTVQERSGSFSNYTTAFVTSYLLQSRNEHY